MMNSVYSIPNIGTEFSYLMALGCGGGLLDGGESLGEPGIGALLNFLQRKIDNFLKYFFFSNLLLSVEL